MKAVIWTRYGLPHVLHLQEASNPVPKDHEVLIKVRAATVTAGDCELRRFDMAAWIWLPVRLYMGILRPRIKILGQELSGDIESVGSAVTQFKVGDAVFAPTKMSMGAYAEYICLPANYAIGIKPVNMSYEEAATLSVGGLNALHFIRKAGIRPGEKVLINGAAGCIGTYAVQLAKLEGAEVTAVDSTRKLPVLSSIGADHVIDYLKDDFLTMKMTYDVIIDIIGTTPFSQSIRLLNPNGRYVLGNPTVTGMLRGAWTSKTSNKKVIVALAPYRPEDMAYLKELAEAGKIRSVIDQRFSLGAGRGPRAADLRTVGHTPMGDEPRDDEMVGRGP
jgi:NADPH:quinone reductase-like Zn-dependent oxidoreductase